jgi:hypothetical protein
MFTNPFLEGIILILLSIMCEIAGSGTLFSKIPDLDVAGNVLFGIGIGYIAGRALPVRQTPKPTGIKPLEKKGND